MAPPEPGGAPDRARGDGDPLTRAAAQLASLAAAVGAWDWEREARALAGAAAAAPPPAAAPTYGELARCGLRVVRLLAAAERWGEAAGQARHLAAYLSDPRAPLDPIGRHAVGSLAAAARVRDREALGDFADLLGEIFGEGVGETERPAEA